MTDTNKIDALVAERGSPKSPYDADYWQESCEHWIRIAGLWRLWAYVYAVIAIVFLILLVLLAVKCADCKKSLAALRAVGVEVAHA